MNIALIPARSGSKRIPDKNIRELQGHPLIAYAIQSARDSGEFERIIVSTDSEKYAEIARRYGAEVPFLRPESLSGDASPDYAWVFHTLYRLWEDDCRPEYFALLRPTSPFRSAATIRRAFKEFRPDSGADSLRAVELCKQHPGKTWIVRGDRMLPVLPLDIDETPWHSNPYQALPRVYAQNASLEIAKVLQVFKYHSISGNTIRPFFTEGYEGFDLNTPIDWTIADWLVRSGKAELPDVQ